MIDKDGNKIVRKEEKFDEVFTAREIIFFMKSFRKNSTDERALSVAKKIVYFLENSDDVTAVSGFLDELEQYARSSKDETFMWNVFYAMREISEKKSVFSDRESAERRYATASFFANISRAFPTGYNRCVEVIELVIAALKFNIIEDNSRADELFDRAKEKYEAIEEFGREIYYRSGKILYLELIRSRSDMKHAYTEGAGKIYLKLARSCHNLYPLNEDKDTLRLMGVAYSDCFGFADFSYEDEKSNIDDTVRWLGEAVEQGARQLSTVLKRLKSKIEEHTK